MGAMGRKILTLAAGLLLAAGTPYLASAAAHAEPGSGGGHECKCDCGHGKECDGGGHHGKHEGMHGKDGGHMHGGHAGKGGPMKEGMARHMEEMRAAIANLRALEAKMDSLKSKDDAAAFRAASLEHSKLLTDLQASHLRHMEGMMGGGK